MGVIHPSQIAATVVSVTGLAFARSADGSVRRLNTGDTILEGETVYTLANGWIELSFNDGHHSSIASLESYLLKPDAMIASAPYSGGKPPSVTNGASNTQSLLSQEDILDNLDPTAAGFIADIDGHSFVRLQRISEDVNPVNYHFGENADTVTSTLAIAIGAVNDLTDGNESVSTPEDTPLSVSAANGVLANTSNPDGPSDATVTQFTWGANTNVAAGSTATINGVGTLQINSDGSYVFTPAANYSGAVPSATYTVTDGADSVTSTLAIAIGAVNDGPTITTNSGNPQGGNDWVYESGLTNGSNPAANSEFAYGSFTVSDNDGLDDIKTIQIGSRIFEIGPDPGQFINLAALVGQMVEVGYGTIELTGYAAGEFEYTYVLDERVDNETVTGAATTHYDSSFSVSVSDDYASNTATITIRIMDDGPSIEATNTLVDEDNLPIVGSNNNSLGDDTQANTGRISYTVGADGFGSITLSTAGNTTNLTKLDGTSINTIWDSNTQTLTGYGGANTADVVFTIRLQNISLNGADYVVTLLQPVKHPLHDDPSTGTIETGFEDNLNISINATIADSDGTGRTTSFTLTIDDDAPTVMPLANGTTASHDIDTNLMLIMDVSGSMNDSANFDGLTRLEAAKQATLELLEQYEALGNVMVNIVTFSTNASNPSSGWVNVATAKSIIQGLTAGGNTNYDDALNTAWNTFGSSGKINGAQNVSYFLSDGAPTANAISGTPVHSPLGGGNGIDSSEETVWEGFLNDNNIKSYALGMGSGVSQGNLEPIAYDGTGIGQEMTAIVVTDLSQLASILASTIYALPVIGDILYATGGTSSSTGADGGWPQSVSILSITASGTSYSYNPLTGNTSISGAGSGTFNTITHEWTITTAAGGTFKIDMDNGEYVYTPPANVGGGLSEVFGYTVIDGDGDTASSTLTITIDPAQGPMVVRDDYVITNQTSVTIPDWALLANDTGPYSNTQTLTGVSSATSGSVTDNTNNTVTFLDDNILDGSFMYTNTANGEAYLAKVTIDNIANNVSGGGDDDDPPTSNTSILNGTYKSEIIIGGSGNETLNGYGGDDILLAGGGNDTLQGGAGDDIMIGGTGRDTFKWSLSEQGTVSSPAIDTIKDFDTRSASSGGDILDLRDLLPNLQSGQDSASSLSTLLHFSLSNGNTRIEVKSSTSLSGPDQVILLEAVDLVTGYSTDTAIIQNLLTNGKLITN